MKIKYTNKIKYIKYNNNYYHHKTTDGLLLSIRVQGLGKEVIVVRHLYKKNNMTSKHSIDVRYFTKMEDGVYLQTKDGIQIKDYENYDSWIGHVLKHIVDLYDSICDKKSKPKGIRKIYETYRHGDVVETLDKETVLKWT
jgi:hypothetical protein